MKLLRSLLVLLLGFAGARADEYEARTFTSPSGSSLPYRLLRPQNYDAAQKYPLVLLFHGAGERGVDNQAQLRHGASLFLKPEVRKNHACFVVAPQCPPEQKWTNLDWKMGGPMPAEPSAAMRLVLGILEAVQKEFSIDADRLYVTGLSMGGYGTWDVIMRHPHLAAAAVPICGGGDKEKVVRAKHLPIWTFHGDADFVVPIERTREVVAALRAAGARPYFSEYPNVAHDSWTPAYQEPELLPWLFAQRRGQAIVPLEKTAQRFAQLPSSEFPAAGPVQPGIWFRALWKGRREEWSKGAPNDRGAVVFFGDSITQGWASLASDFPQLKTANRGISGDTTRGLIYRLKDDVLAVHPRAVSMLIGTNDLGLGASPELVLENIKTIVAELHKADPKMPIVINKVMPRGPQPGKFPDKIVKLNALLDETFKSNPQVTFCDTWSLFDDGNGTCKKEEFPDMLHPNAAGYAKWKSALEPIFEKLGVGKR